MNFESITLQNKSETSKSVDFEVLDTPENVADHVAELIVNRIVSANENPEKENMVLLLPTGKTPKAMYSSLVEKIKHNNINTEKIVIARVEGFASIDEGDARSFDQYVINHFFKPLHITPNEHNFLKIENLVNNSDLENHSEQERYDILRNAGLSYDKKITEMGGIDLAILGLGGDAHVGDVQPSDMESSASALKVRHTRPMNISKDFDEYTQKVFAKEYADKGGNLPSDYFITLGLSVLHQSKELVIMATGQSKSNAVLKGYTDVQSQWQNSRPREELVSPFGFLIGSTAGEKTAVHVVLDNDAAADIKNLEQK